ncbi:Glutaminase A [Geodia barretti]|nr:Glutaminase A [Geodia barretti]
MTPALAVAWDLGVVSPGITLSRSLTLAYDQVYSIKVILMKLLRQKLLRENQVNKPICKLPLTYLVCLLPVCILWRHHGGYFGTLMAPQWKQEFGSAEKMLAEVNRDELIMTMDSEDDRITSQLYAEGGSNYTTISSLAWRQATGATVAVYNYVTDETWMFMKEISSDGDVSTVDVVYPASPLFLWNYNHSFSPIKLILLPILNYANNETAKYGLNVPYNLSWAPHHLGTWPVCDLPPNRQEQMPMEESGNMLIMLAYLVKRDGDLSFLEPYWNLLSIWGQYLAASLPDPEDQLCTDDFEGPSPHNSNLAVKGMVGLRAYAYLLEKKKETKEAEELQKMDLNFTKIWWLDSMDGLTELHSRLQYNLHDTWSLKYNFLFRQVMNFTDIFTDEDITRELNFYMTRINEFGIPLDDRQAYTKADWQMWVAAMGTQDQFETITDLVYSFADKTPNMVPMTDWYYTFTAELKGFRARPVVGGFFSRMLLNYAVKA